LIFHSLFRYLVTDILSISSRISFVLVGSLKV
jgi:hypothetical protein